MFSENKYIYFKNITSFEIFTSEEVKMKLQIILFIFFYDFLKFIVRIKRSFPIILS